MEEWKCTDGLMLTFSVRLAASCCTGVALETDDDAEPVYGVYAFFFKFLSITVYYTILVYPCVALMELQRIIPTEHWLTFTTPSEMVDAERWPISGRLLRTRVSWAMHVKFACRSHDGSPIANLKRI